MKLATARTQSGGTRAVRVEADRLVDLGSGDVGAFLAMPDWERLAAAATEALAMVLHELVTNASKYGALSIPEGRVSVNWECRNSGDAPTGLTMVWRWRETGGPPVSAPSQYGYGTSLICDLIPHELGGTVDLAFSPEGVSCTIEIPLKADITDVA